MTIYIITFTILLAFMLVYFRIAKHFNIIDKPNERSSHSKITIRGGGIIFPIAALLWFFFFGFQQPWFIAGLIIVSLISFLDDIMNIPNTIRSIAHLLAVSLLFWQLQLFGLPWYILLSTYIITIGWINAVNFMDGINGITALYSLVAIISFYWLSQSISFVDTDILILLGFSVIIFSWFNLRKHARVFAGDIGSVSIAFLLAWFMISLIKTTNEVGYILFFAVYAIDSVITIMFRLYKRENIFKAHRSHLYQYLCNELKWSHISVSILYSIVQLLINIIALYLINSGNMSFVLLLFIFAFLSGIYLFIRFRILRKVEQIASLASAPTGGSS
jgi:UDP-GlcNAc:undecaprenyl-phosphate GlcNAc-1-phosphate transferase